jgi:hypothetical protein
LDLEINKNKMETQNFKNHNSFKFSWHLIGGLLIAFILFVYSIVSLIREVNEETIFRLFFTFSFLIIAYYCRRFSTRNQDRIIRMEMRYRYHLLTGIRFETFEKDLSIQQIVAIRFAGDDELESLIKRTISEKLAPKDIKSAIKNWQGDYQRI